MRAFLGKSTKKAFYMRRVKAHRAADQLVKGRYWEGGKGCAVGCMIHGSEHERFETEIGIPRSIAYLVDGLFESLPNEKTMELPERFIAAIPVGADLSLVIPRFLLWLLSDETDGVHRFADDPGKAAITTVADLFRQQIAGEQVTEAAGAAAGAAARAAAGAAAGAAARAAAWAAAGAAARDAAWDAAWAAAGAAAWDAAWDAAWAAAGAAAWAAAGAAAGAAARIRQTEKLLELLAEAPVFADETTRVAD